MICQTSSPFSARTRAALALFSISRRPPSRVLYYPLGVPVSNRSTPSAKSKQSHNSPRSWWYLTLFTAKMNDSEFPRESSDTYLPSRKEARTLRIGRFQSENVFRKKAEMVPQIFRRTNEASGKLVNCI